MSEFQEPPGVIYSCVLLILAGLAIYCGIDAILSESATTPSQYGEGTQVYGIDTYFLGVGWVLLGVGFLNRVVASYLKITGDFWISMGLCVTGVAVWFLSNVKTGFIR